MNIAIIGAGLIGKKRAQSLPKNVRLALVCDIDRKKALDFSQEFKCVYETDWKKVISNREIEAVIISTPNKYLMPIASAAILKGKHVLIEKPGARNLKELKKITTAYKTTKKKVVVMFGYNHRYHPSMLKAKELVASKKFGPILFIRAKYGHGGRIGYEKEWRFDRAISGGGELIDQGSHLIDLVNQFAGKLKYHASCTSTLFWKTDLEDTSFFILKGKRAVANLSVSCVEWKNIFCFEVMLKTAKIQIDGLGKSYGKEKLTLYTMSPEMGPPKVDEFNFPEKDLSWEHQNRIFFEKIKSRDFGDKDIKDAQYVFKIIDKIYKNT